MVSVRGRWDIPAHPVLALERRPEVQEPDETACACCGKAYIRHGCLRTRLSAPRYGRWRCSRSSASIVPTVRW